MGDGEALPKNGTCLIESQISTDERENSALPSKWNGSTVKAYSHTERVTTTNDACECVCVEQQAQWLLQHAMGKTLIRICDNDSRHLIQNDGYSYCKQAKRANAQKHTATAFNVCFGDACCGSARRKHFIHMYTTSAALDCVGGQHCMLSEINRRTKVVFDCGGKSERKIRPANSLSTAIQPMSQPAQPNHVYYHRHNVYTVHTGIRIRSSSNLLSFAQYSTRIYNTHRLYTYTYMYDER